ncbi:HEAT repeat domain-containing protein [bacterium]|nr:HEAT repeat domain-containing protein [bacterium]
MTDMSSDDLSLRRQPELTTVIESLKDDTQKTTSSIVFYGLSGLSDHDLEQIKPVWLALSSEKRRKLMRQMVEISETDFEMDYSKISLFALDDEDAGVREAAIEALWENETTAVMERLITLAENDPIDAVRARALTGLGSFILMGELEDMPLEPTLPARDLAVRLLQDSKQPLIVRRRALESIANCSHEAVTPAIREAYYSDNHEMRVSAVFAMGRTCDPQWRDMILAELESRDEELRFEAARASGELELRAAVPLLARLVTEDDIEIRDIAVWSLGEIGGSEAMRILNLVAESAEEADDEDLLEIVEEAIGSASLAGGDLPFMLSLDDDDFDDVLTDVYDDSVDLDDDGY